MDRSRPSRSGRTRAWLIRLGLLLVLQVALQRVLAPRPEQFVPAPGVYSGCGSRTYQVGSHTYALSSGGMTRTYLLHVPPGYNPDRPTPLILNFHGYAMNAALEERYTAMSALADRARVIVAYPEGTPEQRPLSWLLPLQGWNSGVGTRFAGDDLRFTQELLSVLPRQLCVDRRRIYVTGLSNGGGMAARLACLAAPRIAALATVAGAFRPLPEGCHPTRAVPVLAIQGTADPAVPYRGNQAANVPSTQGWAAAWARRDGCSTRPTRRRLVADVVQTRYTGCRDGTAVIVDAVVGGGHTWPGARENLVPIGRTARDFDATAAIWTFFASYRAPA